MKIARDIQIILKVNIQLSHSILCEWFHTSKFHQSLQNYDENVNYSINYSVRFSNLITHEDDEAVCTKAARLHNDGHLAN